MRAAWVRIPSVLLDVGLVHTTTPVQRDRRTKAMQSVCYEFFVIVGRRLAERRLFFFNTRATLCHEQGKIVGSLN